MGGGAADFVGDQLGSGGVQGGAGLESELVNRVLDRTRAADGAGGTVEAGEKAVSGRVKFTAVEAGELPAYAGVVLSEQHAPAAVAEVGWLCGRADDIGGEDGREQAGGLRHRARAGQELLKLVCDLVRVPGRDPMVGRG